MPVYDNIKDIPQSATGWVKRDGKYYTGTDKDRILRRDADEKTVKELKDRVGTGSKIGAYALDALNILNVRPTPESVGNVSRYKRTEEKYNAAKKRLEENKYRKGGKVKKSSGVRRGDGIAQRGKTKGRFV